MEIVDITPIVVAIITLCSTIITVLVAPLIKAKLSTEQRNNLRFWIQIGVGAAEQLAKNGTILKENKKEYVLQFLADHGITADMDEILAILEHDVLNLPNNLIIASELDSTLYMESKTDDH